MQYKKKSFWLDVLLLISILVFISLFLSRNATMVYDFFDMSAFMDAGYRVYSGQEPYVDFYYIAGPIHLYMHAFFFWFFGFSKTAVLVHLCAINAVVVAITYFLARQHLAVVESVLLAILSSFCFYGPISHPWYDQNASFWLVLGILFLEIQVLRHNHTSTLKPDRRAFLTGLCCGALVGLSFLTKANIGLAGGLMFLAVFFVSGQRFQSIIGYIFGVLISLIGVMLTLKSPTDFVYQAFFAYNPGTRFLDLSKFFMVIEKTPYLILLGIGTCIVSLGGREYVERNLTRFVLLVGLLITSSFAAFTGSMIIQANISLLGIEMVYLFMLARQLPNGSSGSAERRIYKTAGGVVIVIALVLLLSATEKTTQLLVWIWHPSNLDNEYALQTEALRGWRCNRAIGEGVDKAVEYIKNYVPKEDSLFVFPDATIIYGLAGRESYRKAPFIFHLNQVPFPGRVYDEFRENFLNSPPKWILLHNQTEVYFFETLSLLRWLQLENFIAIRYKVVWHWGDFILITLSSSKTG